MAAAPRTSGSSPTDCSAPFLGVGLHRRRGVGLARLLVLDVLRGRPHHRAREGPRIAGRRPSA
eukprot:1779154-Alexandrium_andersonii.AAC.1